MKNYRIVEYCYSESNKQYEIQKKSIFGFWYNPNNIDGGTTGFYDTIEKAEEAVEREIAILKKRVIKEYNQ